MNPYGSKIAATMMPAMQSMRAARSQRQPMPLMPLPQPLPKQQNAWGTPMGRNAMLQKLFAQ